MCQATAQSKVSLWVRGERWPQSGILRVRSGSKPFYSNSSTESCSRHTKWWAKWLPQSGIIPPYWLPHFNYCVFSGAYCPNSGLSTLNSSHKSFQKNSYKAHLTVSCGWAKILNGSHNATSGTELLIVALSVLPLMLLTKPSNCSFHQSFGYTGHTELLNLHNSQAHTLLCLCSNHALPRLSSLCPSRSQIIQSEFVYSSLSTWVWA